MLGRKERALYKVAGLFGGDEKVPYGSNYHGVRIELHNLDRTHARLAYALKALEALPNVTIEGHLPTEDEGLVIANHASSIDGALLPILAVREGRTMQMVVKHTLVDINAVEDEEVLEATGKTGETLNKQSKMREFLTTFIPYFDPVVVQRGKGFDPRRFIKEGSEPLQNGHVEGIFLQWTRRPEGDLTASMPGAATLARANPDKRLYIVTINGTHKGLGKILTGQEMLTIRIHEPFTYNDIPEEIRKGGGAADRVTNYFASLMAPDLPIELKREWVKQHGGSELPRPVLYRP